MKPNFDKNFKTILSACVYFLERKTYTVMNAIFSTMENKGRYAKP